MKCPTCQQEMELLDPFGDGEQYHVCRAHKPPLMIPIRREAAPRAEPPSTSALAARETPRIDAGALVRETFPTPIVVAYGRVHDEGLGGLERLRAVALTHLLLIQISALVLWRDFIAGRGRDRAVEVAVERLSAPSPDRWYEVLQALSRIQVPEGDGSRAAFSQGLMEAARVLDHGRHGGQPIQQALRAFRHRLEQQGPSWTEQAQAGMLGRITPVLDAALGLMAPLREVVLLRDLGDGRILRLVGPSERLAPEATQDDRLLKALGRSPVLALNRTRVLSLHPLVVAPESTSLGERDEVMLYNGHSDAQVSYLGVFGRATRADTIRALSKLIDAAPVTGGLSAQARVREITAQVLEGLTGARYLPSIYLERPSLDGAVDAFVDARAESVCLVVGEPGSGRRSLLCRQARRALEAKVDAVALLAGQRGSVEARLRELLGAGPQEALVDALARWREATGAGLTVLTDAPMGAGGLKALDDLALAAHQANGAGKGQRWLRIVVTADGREVKAAISAWSRHHATPFAFAHAFAFAHFSADQGDVPFLTISPFSDEQSAKVYAWASHVVPQGCPAPWNQLSAQTRRALRKPHLIYLHHLAFGGVSRPDPVDEDGLWQAWFERLFEGRKGGNALGEVAFWLVERCMQEGEGGLSLSRSRLFEARARWMERLGGAPDRMASSLDPVERLEGAGLVCGDGRGVWGWVWEPLATRLILEVLLERTEWLGEETLDRWLALPASESFDEALAMACQRLQRKVGEGALGSLARRGDARAMSLLITALSDAAPEDGAPDGAFRATLEGLNQAADKPSAVGAWKDALLWGVAPVLSESSGARRHVLEVATGLLERLAVLQPEEASHLRDLARAYQQLGELDYAQDPDRATRWFERGEDMARRLSVMKIAASPNDSSVRRSYLLDLSASYKGMAPMVRQFLGALDDPHRASMRLLTGTYQQMGDKLSKMDAEKARGWFDKGRVMAEHLLELEPDNLNHLADLGRSYQRLSDLDARHDPAQARVWLQKHMETLRRLIEADPAAIEHQRALACAHNRIGELEEASDLKAARRWYEKALELRKALSEAHPQDAGVMAELSSSCHRMGRLESQLDPDKAHGWFERDLSLCARLVSLAPDDLDRQRNLAVVYFRLGELDAGRTPTRARGYLEKDVAISEKLSLARPEDGRILEGLLTSYALLVTLEEPGNPPRAHAWALKRLDAARRLKELNPTDAPTIQRLAEAYGQLGELDMERHPARAAEWFELLRATLDQLCARRPEDPALWRQLTRCYQRLGALSQAQDPDSARRWLIEGIKANERLMALAPQDTQHLLDTAALYAAMATVEAGSSAQESAWLGKALALLDRRLERAPGDPMAMAPIVQICDRLAELDGRVNPKRADTWRLRSALTRAALVPIDPDRETFEGSVQAMMAASGLNDALQEVSRRWLEASIDGLEQIIAVDPKNADHQRNLAVCRVLLGDLEMPKNPDLAVRLFTKGLARVERQAALEPLNVVYLHDLAQIYMRLTRYERAHRPSKARDWNEHQVSALERLLALEPDRRRTLKAMAQACEDMGEMLSQTHPSKATPWFARAQTLRERLGA